ncbi:MAG: hypothetical protein JWN03_2243 [Nocardia sp.]|nr:hypothetical protein [Nocardia sp.]
MLARLYQEVADGGFGPGYQLLPLLGPEPSVLSEYLQRREASIDNDDPQWPEGVVPILTWGCAMYAVVDCQNADGRVLLFEPNAYDGRWEQAWFLDAESLAGWLEIWLAGTGWFEEDASDRDDVNEPQPWTQAGARLEARA